MPAARHRHGSARNILRLGSSQVADRKAGAKHSYHEFNQKVYELMNVNAGIDVQMIDHPMVESLAGLSDQRSYWEFGIPALMINDTSFIRNPNYHTMNDDIETLSCDHIREVVTCAYKSVVGF